MVILTPQLPHAARSSSLNIMLRMVADLDDPSRMPFAVAHVAATVASHVAQSNDKCGSFATMEPHTKRR